MEGPQADSEEKREPVSDIDIAVVDSLKVLDPNRPIREADSCTAAIFVFVSMASSLFEDRALDGGSASIHCEFRALNETRAICR
jgi:hypothetical protein